MKYSAEIFDKFQFLYKETGYCDRQVRCVVSFNGSADPETLKKAAEMLLSTVPILSRKYVNLGNKSYWEDTNFQNVENVFTVTYSKTAFDSFSCSMTDAENGPQIKFCLLCAENNMLVAVINHMVSDAAGLKQCMYLYAEIYSNLIRDPNYLPDFIIDGDRGFKNIVCPVSFPHRLISLLFGSKDSNQKSLCGFSMENSGKVEPFVMQHEISPKVFRDMKEYCHVRGITVNDVVLTAYLRALSKMLGMQGQEIAVPIMIDMRRYLKDKNFNALTNLSSTSIVKRCIPESEDFESSLAGVNAIMNAKKENGLGLNTFFKLYAGFRIPFIDAYKIMRKALKNPPISMTNIGVIDSAKLLFENTEVRNAVMFASIKYRPYFQISVSSFNDRMTLGTGLYGDEEDRANIIKLFELMDGELQAMEACRDAKAGYHI